MIEPGRSTSVGLKQKIYNRIETPKVSCQDEGWLKTPTGTFKKTFDTCNKICKQDHIFRKCSCVSTKFLTLLDTNVHYCLEFNLTNAQDTMERVYCEWKNFDLSDDEFMKCKQSCLWPCHQIQYETLPFSSKWPNYGAVQDFINQFVLTLNDSNPIKTVYFMIRDHYMLRNEEKLTSENNAARPASFINLVMDMILDNKYDPDIMNQLSSNKPLALTTDPILMNLSSLEKAQETWVNKGFYRLNVYWRESSVEVHRQVLSYNSADLGSGLGGILGLWAGVSLISCVEFIVFIGAICKVVCQNFSTALNQRLKTDRPTTD